MVDTLTFTISLLMTPLSKVHAGLANFPLTSSTPQEENGIALWLSCEALHRTLWEGVPSLGTYKFPYFFVVYVPVSTQWYITNSGNSSRSLRNQRHTLPTFSRWSLLKTCI